MSKATEHHGEMTENRRPHSRIEGARDGVDDALVGLLCENARLTLTALAQRLNLSRTAVQARMARLERDGVILGYQAVVAPPRSMAGSESLEAILSLTFSRRPCAPVVATFRHWPEIDRYYSVTGAVDGYAVVRVASPAALSALVDRFSAVEGVDAVRCAVVLKSA